MKRITLLFVLVLLLIVTQTHVYAETVTDYQGAPYINEDTAYTIGRRFSAYIDAEGNLILMGASDISRQLEGESVRSHTIVGPWKSISIGGRFAVALAENGTLHTWGRNNYGQLGDGTTKGRYDKIKQVGTDSDWKMAVAGFDHVLAIKEEGNKEVVRK